MVYNGCVQAKELGEPYIMGVSRQRNYNGYIISLFLEITRVQLLFRENSEIDYKRIHILNVMKMATFKSFYGIKEAFCAIIVPHMAESNFVTSLEFVQTHYYNVIYHLVAFLGCYS